MTVSRVDLQAYLDNYLCVVDFEDYCPNGLQVEGAASITRLVSGVTACQQLLDEAVRWDADAILVHHGYFWRGESPRVAGMKRRRLATLLQHDINLFAYHLPLDAHPVVGNNTQLGELMGVARRESWQTLSGGLGNVGELAARQPVRELLETVQKITGRTALHIGDTRQSVQRIAWCTGAAQSYIEMALAAGAEVFVSGEISEQTVHVAREEGIHFIAAGHHATERFGVQALGAHLEERFGLQHRYIEIDNPV